MATMKFPCTQCKQMMAVGHELAGRKVRCPHCQAVVVAPTLDVPAAESEVHFNLGPKEEADSIFGEAVDDDLFGSPQKPVVEMPATPSLVAPPDSNPFGAAFAPTKALPPKEPAGVFADNSDRKVRPTPSSSGGSGAVTALSILVPYAIFMTVVAITYYMKFENAKQSHPLEQIPDLLGEFKNKQSKGSTAQSLVLPKPGLELPDSLVTSLGRPITVGAIEVTPLKVTQEPVVAFEKEKGKDEPEKRVSKSEHLVLHLRLKNVSPDLTFYPSDPYFDRRPKSANDRPYSMVEVGKDKFYGGLVEYAVEPGRVERTWVSGQENDHLPLKPGESRTTVVVTHPKDGVIAAVNASKSPAVWRVHVRRGMVPYRDTEVPASCVIGVTFTGKDVVKGA